MTALVPARHSLKTRITLSILGIFLVCIWALAFFTSRMVREDMQLAMGEQQFSTATFVASSINQDLNERLLLLETQAGMVTPAMLSNSAATQAFLEDHPVPMSHFNAGIFITRRDGIPIADVPVSAKRLGLSVIDRDYLIAVLQEGKSSIGSPVIGKSLKSPIVAMATPIRDAQGMVIGAIVGVTDLNKSNIFDKITGNGYGKTGGYVLIDRKHRQVVSATDNSRIMKRLPPPGINPESDRFIDGYEGFGIVTNPLGVEVLAAAKGIPVAGWHIVVGLPTMEAFATIRDMQQRMLIVALFLTLMAGIATWQILRRQLSPMLAAITALATISENGQHTQALPITSRDEIGELVGGFNRLLKSLGQSEQALKESEFRWKFAIEGSGDGLWDWNVPDGTIFFSKRWKEMLGFDEDEIGSGLDEWEKRIHPDDKPQTLTALRDCLDGKTPLYVSEHRVLCKDGSYKWILDRGMVVARNEEGKPLRMIGTHSDISERKRREEQFRKTSLAVEQSPNSIVITSAGGEIEYVNDAFVNATGYSREEAIGQNPRILKSGKNPPETYADLWSNLKLGLPWKGQFHNKRKNGTEFTESAIVAPVHQPGGPITHYVAIKVDISEEIRLKERLALYQSDLERTVEEKTHALSEEKLLLHDLVDALPFGTYRISTGISPGGSGEFPPDELMMASARYCEMLDIGLAEARTGIGAVLECIHPEDRAEFVRLNKEASAELKPFAWEGRMNLKGSIEWMRIDEIPRVSSDKVIWTGVLQNITEKTLQSSLIYRSVIEASPDAFVAIDEDDRIVEWSPQAERIFGQTAAEVLGQSLAQTIIPQAHSAEHNNHLSDFVATGRDGVIGKRRKLTAMRKDGSEIPIELQVMALQIGGHWRFTSFIRDITDETRVAQQLAQAQKLESIGHLTGGLAHDFNNMLGIILGNLDLLSDAVPSGEPREMLDAAIAAAQRAAEVTKSLLAVARRRNLTPREVDINQLLLELQPLLKQTVGKRVQFTLSAHAEQAYAMLDAGGFNNALLNIAINARDAMPAGGDMLVYSYSMRVEPGNSELPDLDPGAYAVVGVDDTGSGMAPEVVRQAFDPFFTTKGRGKGTGLGLAMVFGFARQSGGTARIVSTLGRGSSVQLILPTRADAENAAQTEANLKARERGLTTGSGRVLVVDDEAALLAVTARWLRNLGYEVATAAAAQPALDMLQQERYDLMLTDIVMPGEMDGAVLARHAASHYPAMHILLASGYPENLSEEDRTRWVLLEKPINQRALSEAVAIALGRRPQEVPAGHIHLES